MSNALPMSKLLRFQDVSEYTAPESHSGSQDSCDVIVPGGPWFSCTAQVHSGQFLRHSTSIQSMNGELCISSEELLSGYDTLGRYKCPRSQEAMARGGSWIEEAHRWSQLTAWQEMQSPGPKRLWPSVSGCQHSESLSPGKAIIEASLLSFGKY